MTTSRTSDENLRAEVRRADEELVAEPVSPRTVYRWGVAGALLSAGIASLVTRFLRAASERAHLLWGAWALTSLVIVIGYFTWNNWP